jgi:uncharacterized membrane protein
MPRSLLPALLLGMSALAVSAHAGDDGPPPAAFGPPDAGDRAAGVFAAKCVECHSADLPHPKGKFGYVLDLPRVAANPKLLVPHHPEKSKLWKLIADGDMPPDNARAGPLTGREMTAVREWIEAGAPPAQHASGPREQQRPPSFAIRLSEWLARFHVVVVHFPIALLLAAALAEAAIMLRRATELASSARFCVRLGAAGAVAAAALGWARAGFGAYRGDGGVTLALHRWVGIAACLCAVVAAVLSFQRRPTGRLFRATLFGSAALVGLAGHLGGLTVYGDAYFRW